MRFERQRLDHLADAADPRPAADEAERRRRRRAPRRPRRRRSRPSAARRRRRPNHRRARRRAGCACRCARAARAADEAQRRGDEVRVVERHAVGERPVGGQPGRRRIDRQRVVPVERDHLGVDEVVAVVAHAGDPQGQRELGRCLRPRRCASSSPPATRWSARPTRRRRAPRGGAAGRCRRRRTPRASTTPASDRRSILRRCPNAVAHQLEQRLRRQRRRRGSVGGGCRPAPTRRSGRGTNTVGRHVADDPRRRPVGDLHATPRRRPRCPARGAQPLGRPRAAPSPASARSAGTPSSRSQTSGVATLYGRLATSTQRAAPASSVVPVEPQGVGLDHGRRWPARRRPRAAPATAVGRPRSR